MLEFTFVVRFAVVVDQIVIRPFQLVNVMTLKRYIKKCSDIMMFNVLQMRFCLNAITHVHKRACMLTYHLIT